MDSAHVVPGAGAMHVCALVASELVDQDAAVSVVVGRALAAARRAARSGDRAVGLSGVLQGTGLE